MRAFELCILGAIIMPQKRIAAVDSSLVIIVSLCLFPWNYDAISYMSNDFP